MTELDLQEQTRRDDVFIKINNLVDQVGDLGVFPPLVWLYVWDIVVDKYNQYSGDVEDWQEERVPEEVTLKIIWDKFWDDSGKAGFTLEYGTEHLHEHVDDWMRDNDLLVALDEDGWLE